MHNGLAAIRTDCRAANFWVSGTAPRPSADGSRSGGRGRDDSGGRAVSDVDRVYQFCSGTTDVEEAVC